MYVKSVFKVELYIVEYILNVFDFQKTSLQ